MNVWNLFAPVYQLSMKSQKNIYDYLYREIGILAKDKEVLELATGPGMIAKHIAGQAKRVLATDFAPKMIAAAKKAPVPGNVTFEVADARNLPYQDNSFDLVIIANALHIMPQPEKALEEIRRVLKADGLMIAPNFIFSDSGKKNLWQKFLSLVGIRFAHEWTENQFKSFLHENGWEISRSQLLKGRINLLYTECKKIKKEE